MARYKHFQAKTRNSLDLVPLTTFVPTETHALENTARLYLLSAPFVSLGGLSPNEKELAKLALPLKPRFFRKQAGLTNRCQSQLSPTCGLLGIAQACKAARVGLNETLMRMMTVDTPLSLSEGEPLKAGVQFRKKSSSLKAIQPKQKPKPRIFIQADPHEMLFSFTQKITEGMEPDVILECLDFEWELHRMYFFKSQVLSQLLATAVQNTDLHTADSYTKEIRCYYKQYLLSDRKHTEETQQEQRKTKVTIALEINDPDVTRFAFAIALRNLYNSKIEVNEDDVLGILASANVLQFPSLFYKLFTFNEFHLLRTTLCWVFLQQNPKIQIIPSYDTILTYFSSLPKICAFLEREIGQRYIAIFQSLRLHGITSSKHLEELWDINFLPLPWLTRILSDHYHALENGGDMVFQRDFNTQAVRFGLVLTEEPRYHAEIVSIYGFFFEIKAVRHEASAYSFYMQRVKHADPIISFFTAERSPVSLKQEREVKYEIKAQCQIDGKWEEFTTERLTQKFGVKKPASKSKVLKASIPSVPIYVTFSFLFPSS
ncbi:BTB/POZ domain-containing protein 16 isoform X5 [Anolis carolinensis]|uniref:BTB/POZ domain-containing protein 16 isoform X5 n=1 Tax=Anolis carolinensis TaxID=28377 RepID=UPI002F2B30DD